MVRARRAAAALLAASVAQAGAVGRVLKAEALVTHDNHIRTTDATLRTALNDGLAGGYYTTSDGLVDDRVVSLALAGLASERSLTLMSGFLGLPPPTGQESLEINPELERRTS